MSKLAQVAAFAAITLLMVVSFCADANRAGAATLVNGTTGQPITSGPYLRWLGQSKTPVPAGVIQIFPNANAAAACNDADASACSLPGQIWIDSWPWRAQFEHEVGHQFDYDHMDPTVAALGATQTPIPLEPWQKWFEQMWGLTGDGWWTFLPHTGGGSPGEWFATAYSACAITGPGLHPSTETWEDAFDFPGYDRPWAMGATCALISRVNADPAAWMTP